MKTILAKEAKEMMQNSISGDLETIMKNIEGAALSGKLYLDVYFPLSDTLLQKLRDLGYEMPPITTTSFSKDGIYHRIHWGTI